MFDSLRADFQHLRRWRKSVEQAQSYTFKAVITVIVAGVLVARRQGDARKVTRQAAHRISATVVMDVCLEDEAMYRIRDSQDEAIAEMLLRLLRAAARRARRSGWHSIVSDTSANVVSANNFTLPAIGSTGRACPGVGATRSIGANLCESRCASQTRDKSL